MYILYIHIWMYKSFVTTKEYTNFKLKQYKIILLQLSEYNNYLNFKWANWKLFKASKKILCVLDNITMYYL